MLNGSFLDMSFLKDLAGARIAVLGGGVTGTGVISFLHNKGAIVDLYDEKPTTISGLQSRQELSSEDSYTFAVASPGWRLDHPLVLDFLDRKIQIYSELDFAWLVKEEVAPEQKWVALTGTNGKTTTIQMLESILISAGINGRACGNVGEPVISALSSLEQLDVLALELSSFQIEWSQLPIFHAVAILNIAEDHIDWHGSFDEYANAKLKLLMQTDTALLNIDDSEVSARSTSWNGRKIYYSLQVPRGGELGLVEELLVDRAFSADPTQAAMLAELSDIQPTVPHNVSNALAAAGLALTLGIPHSEIQIGLKNFKVDHHRLELVASADGISWVNDSKATNPHAAFASIMSALSVVWIAGGLAKGASMDELIKRGASRIRAAILIGQDRDVIADALAKFAPQIPVVKIDKGTTSAELMRQVVERAKEFARDGDTVLLAPACASMDQFKSYAERGDLFAEAVRESLDL